MPTPLFRTLPAPIFFEELVNNPNAVLIDVRTQAEYEEAHIVNAELIDIKQTKEFADEITDLDRTKSYYLYCRIAIRSANACWYMQQLGFQHLAHLKGGIEGVGEELWEKYIRP